MENYRALQEFIGKFIVISPEEFGALKKSISLLHIRKRDIITRAGETELYLYFVAKGLIREYFYKGTKQITTDIISEGTITGSVTSFFTGAPSHYCLEAMEPCTLFGIHKASLELLYRTDRKWEKFGRILTAHFLLQQEWEILNIARFSPRERFLHFTNRHRELLQRVPQKYLASYLQIKPETFSRMKHLLKQGNIKNPAHEK